ncbi:MAG: hypothetical protein IJO29_01655 [Oscillospiraceae bacterium]|nr:hypothetical protein [Oscillospiraceae bacterium]
MPRPRKFKSAKELEEKWAEYKEYCNNRTTITHGFSSKNSEFVSAELKRCVTYTIEGFCVYIGISRSTFYDSYADNDKFSDIVTRIREECEADAREKFELGIIPTQLAGLWMSKYGYSTKQENQSDDKILEQLDKVLGGIKSEF